MKVGIHKEDKSVRKPSQLLPAATIDSARDAQEILPAAAAAKRAKGHAMAWRKGRTPADAARGNIFPTFFPLLSPLGTVRYRYGDILRTREVVHDDDYRYWRSSQS